MAALKSLVSRILLWLGIGVFCAALAVACSLAQTPETPAQTASAQAPPRPTAAPSPAITPAAARGRDYARAGCADCHQVEPGGPQPPYSAGPAFHKVATTPGMTSIALLAWLHTSHLNMPNLVVPRDRLDDLLAWFDYLRAAGKNPPKQAQ